ncbi:MAG: cell envelope integrity protein CreD [bacterium]
MDSDSVVWKLLFIGVISVLMLIPLKLIEKVIEQRDKRRTKTEREITAKWGQSQTINGPILHVPYVTENNDSAQSSPTQYARFLPHNLSVTGTVKPDIRYRSIYEVVLYHADLTLRAEFEPLQFDQVNVPRDNIRWGQAFVSVGLSDLKGIRQEVKLNWNGETVPFEPIPRSYGFFKQGLRASLPTTANWNPEEKQSVTFNLKLNGNEGIKFTPTGKNTHVKLKSSWPHPSFQGTFLPEKRQISDEGFSARWNVFYLNRNFPQQWINEEFSASELQKSSFGVNLYFPVDTYQQALRSTKYGLMFIALTFVTFFLFEILSRISVHAVEYLLVGFAVCLFYLLLISLAELIGFGIAYFLASFATILLITCYSSSILGARNSALIVGGLLTGLYSYLYVLLQVEMYALLMGSIGLFLILSVIMYLTRNVDWYDLRTEDE